MVEKLCLRYKAKLNSSQVNLVNIASTKSQINQTQFKDFYRHSFKFPPQIFRTNKTVQIVLKALEEEQTFRHLKTKSNKSRLEATEEKKNSAGNLIT